MIEQPSAPDGSPIPMPALTPAALHAAVAQIAPAQLPSFVEHLDRAVAAQSTISPLRTFLQWWGEFVAIQRYPARAARLRELEGEAEQATDREAVRSALAEMRQITELAHHEDSRTDRGRRVLTVGAAVQFMPASRLSVRRPTLSWTPWTHALCRGSSRRRPSPRSMTFCQDACADRAVGCLRRSGPERSSRRSAASSRDFHRARP